VSGGKIAGKESLKLTKRKHFSNLSKTTVNYNELIK